MSAFSGLRSYLLNWLLGPESNKGLKPLDLASVTAVVDDQGPWASMSGRPHDYDAASVQEQYADALSAWRKNPIAWRITAITTDYILGDKLHLTSSNRRFQRFISAFWNHPKNRMDNRLESMSDELSRAGDLFVLLFRNPQDGMSYVRFITKDTIQRIETSPTDWETEIAYYEKQPIGDPVRWPSPHADDADTSPAIMLHYSVNRPLGALLGESDLTTMLPWLLRYSRMLEDRVRLHWAVRAFMWIVTVPTNRIKEKMAQYRNPPEAGSIIVKDDSETWAAVTPNLQSSDAQHDMKAVRGMIDAGSGFPPHWRGEPQDANLATATAMQAPTERHLARRQNYFIYILQDIIFNAYTRQVQAGLAVPLPQGASSDYASLFTVQSPDISRSDNESLSTSAKNMADVYQILIKQLPSASPSLHRLLLKLVFKFSGEPQDDEVIDELISSSLGVGLNEQ
ncbi:MAG: hypothetical protein MUO64_20560 [Anaerolineales bacterium]|nr:hypothetical protein [Anaerolineales bacterium]